MKFWLAAQAEAAQSSEELVRCFVEECRRRQIILPGISTIERLCADALVAAERRIEARIAVRLDDRMRARLDSLLNENTDGHTSWFVWMRQFEVGNNTADINRLLGRLEFLQELDLPTAVLDSIPPHRITRLRRQGERYFTDGLRDISGNRRLAILAVCVVEWSTAIADAVVETHDRIAGRIWRDAKQSFPSDQWWVNFERDSPQKWVKIARDSTAGIDLVRCRRAPRCQRTHARPHAVCRDPGRSSNRPTVVWGRTGKEKAEACDERLEEVG